LVLELVFKLFYILLNLYLNLKLLYLTQNIFLLTLKALVKNLLLWLFAQISRVCLSSLLFFEHQRLFIPLQFLKSMFLLWLEWCRSVWKTPLHRLYLGLFRHQYSNTLFALVLPYRHGGGKFPQFRIWDTGSRSWIEGSHKLILCSVSLTDQFALWDHPHN